MQPREAGSRLVLFGKHEEKMRLITAPNVEKIDARDANKAEFDSAFDVVVEASGHPSECFWLFPYFSLRMCVSNAS